MTTTTTMVAKTTCFPDDIWSQIKGFLFESNLKCYWCKYEIPNGTHKLIKHIRLVKSLENRHYIRGDVIGVVNKKTGECFSCFSYNDIASNAIPPFSNNLEEYYTFKKAELVNLWYCRFCWSNHMFKPYTIREKIQNHYSLNYSQTEKICLKLTNMFCADDNSDCGMTIFDGHRLKATREKYETYIRFMEEYYIDKYKEDKGRFDRGKIIEERQLRNDFKIYVKNVYLSRVNELHKELALYQISKQFKTGKISYNVFKKLMDMSGNKSYAERILIAFGRDIYD